MIVDPVLLVVIPLSAAFLVPLISMLSKKLAEWIPILGLLGMAIVMAINLPELFNGPITSTTGGFNPPWGISIIMTPLGGLFAAGMIGVGLFVSISGISDSGRPYQAIYNTFVMMATAGAVGMVITGDLFNMFVFLEITSISGVVLAAMPRKGHEKGLNWRGAAVYAVVGGVASFLVLAGIALLYGATSTLNIAQIASRIEDVDTFVIGAAFLAMFVGFGIESELFPLNGWAPEVYRGSRWGTSSLFSGVIGKAGLLALIRVSITVLSPGLENDLIPDILLWVGAATYIFGEAAAFSSKDLYRILGYSSIGMFGLLTVSFSLGIEDGIRGGILLLIGHMLVKPLLFSMTSFAGRMKKGDVPISSLKGLIRTSPLAGILLTIGILALIGMPPSPIFWGKFLIISSAGSEAQWLLIGILLTGTILEAGYLGRMLYNILDTRRSHSPSKLPFARGLMGIVAVLTILLIGIVPGPLNDMADLIVKELMDPSIYTSWGVI